MTYIIGLDPGKVTGYCRLHVLDGAVTVIDRRDWNGDRADLYMALRASIVTDHIAVEQPFLTRGADTLDAATKFGVAQLVAELDEIPFHAYYPGTVRKVICGSGRAKDADVTAVVREVLGIPQNPGKGHGLGKHQPAALAVALTCAVEECGVRLETATEEE